MNMTRRQALLTGASSFALMAFLGPWRNDGGLPAGPATFPHEPIEYVDAVIMHSGAVAANEFTTWSSAKTYFRNNVNPATQRGRLTYEYSTTPYGDAQRPLISTTDNFTDSYSLHVQGQSGGPATAINDTHLGDDATSTFAWSLPGGVVSPIGAGDLTVRLDGVTLKLGKDYRFRYDTYLSGAGNWPSTSGDITLITWTGGNPSTEVVRPLATGETLTVQSIEARPVIETSINPIELLGGSYNPDRYVPGTYLDYYGVENLVLTTTVPYARRLTILADNVRINKVFGFKLGGNGIGDNSPSFTQHPRMYSSTQFELLNSTLFDASDSSALTHSMYIGWYGTTIMENVVSTDPQFFDFTGQQQGHCMKVKSRKGHWMKDCFLGVHSIGKWMGNSYYQTGQAPLSTHVHADNQVIEDCIFHNVGGGRAITNQNRFGWYNRGVGAHAWGRVVYGMYQMRSAFAAGMPNIGGQEWNLDVAAGTTVFNVTKSPQWDLWDVTSKDELVVSVWPNVSQQMPTLLTSDQFSMSLVNGEGTIDLSGGPSPAYPSGVPEGSVVFVSCMIKRDEGDLWTDAYWNQIKVCRVFTAGWASGSTPSVAWSRFVSNYGVTHLPDDADFHVSVNGATLALGVDYTVTGGGTTSGSINFTPALSDGDFYMITTDGHKTQGIPATTLESIQSRYYRETYAPAGPAIEPWTLPAGYRWPTVYRTFIRNCDFWQDNDSSGNNRVVLAEATLPYRPYDDSFRHFTGVPTGWAEQAATYVTGCTTWNFDGTFYDEGVSQYYGFVPVHPQWGSELFRMADGGAPTVASPSESQLPEWWLTFDDAPARIAV